jgi:hypothetical protein
MNPSQSRTRPGAAPSRSSVRSYIGRVFCGLALAASSAVQAAPIVQDFESFSDGDIVGSSLAGLTFTQATVLTAGLSLNNVDFPPQSGANVISDDGGAITIVFATPVNSVGAFLTYNAAITFEAFDASANSLGSVASLFGANYVTGGDAGSAPNEFLQITSAAGISRVVFSGNPAGGSFALDDLTYDRRGGGTVPLPGTALLLLAAGGAAVAARRRSS